MKLDSAPLSLSALTETESPLAIEDTIESNLNHTDDAIASVETVVTGGSKKRESIVATFATTFVTIFLAEIGDKTQLSTLLMSAESHTPWVVFIGSATALITTSLLGVLLGSWISSKFSPKAIDRSAGVMLLFISLMLFWDVIQG